MANNSIRSPLAVADANVPSIMAPSASKRKAAEIEDEEDEHNIPITQSCNQVRTKIRALINSGEMKVTEFQKAIGVHSKSYGRFMGYKGAYQGSDNGTYYSAFLFFRKREQKGVKIPKKKVKKDDAEKALDVSSVSLPGESENAVPVYDSCDEIRRKINAHLREPGVTQAGFLREIVKTYSDGKKIQSKVLNDFLNKKGASAGNTSSAFYASYVFFEKMRLRDGKDKSKHRVEMEKRNPGGLDTERRRDRIWCMQGETPVEDAYGGISFSKR